MKKLTLGTLIVNNWSAFENVETNKDVLNAVMTFEDRCSDQAYFKKVVNDLKRMPLYPLDRGMKYMGDIYLRGIKQGTI